MSDFSRKAVFVAAVAFALAFAFQGSRALWAPDEGIFGAVSKEMIESGNWLIPTLHQQPYPEKPPLMYWMMISGMDLLGRNEWGLRLFFALTLPLTAWFVGLIGAELWGRREGLLAALVYVTMIWPIAGANVARPDAPLTLFVAAAFFYFIKSVRLNDPSLYPSPQGEWGNNDPSPGGSVLPLSSQERGPGGEVRGTTICKMLMCVAFGFGFLSKGPAVLVFAAPMFVYLLLTGRTLRYFLTPWAIVGIAIFAVIGLSWYWMMIRSVSGAAAYFWDNEVWGRLVTSTYRRNSGFLEGIIKVYGPALLAGPLPWLFAWPFWIAKTRPPIFTAAWWQTLRERRNALLLALWVVLPVAVFMFAKSKLPFYVLPVFPAIALLTARAWVLYPLPRLARPDGLPRASFVAAWAMVMIACKGIAAHPDSVQKFGLNLSDRDERILAAAIEKRLPSGCTQVWLVNEERNGIAFYLKLRVLDTTFHDSEYPNFIPTPQLSRLIDEALASKTTFAVYSRSKKKQLDAVEAVFNAKGIAFDRRELPDEHVLLVPTEKTDLKIEN